MSVIAIIQPTYLPWIGYFDLMDQVYKFVFLDSVNVLKRSWDVRNRIKTSQGELFLTVPLQSDLHRDLRLFSNTRIDYTHNWQKKHLSNIVHAYAKVPFFEEVYHDFEQLIKTKYSTIAELNITIICFIADKIGIKTLFYKSSEISGIEGRKDVRLVNICHALGATKYLSPQGSAAYIEAEQPGGAFPSAGIELYYHNFEHPTYPQQDSFFMSHMSIIDLLMNCGYERALDVIRSGRREMFPYQKFRINYFSS